VTEHIDWCGNMSCASQAIIITRVYQCCAPGRRRLYGRNVDSCCRTSATRALLSAGATATTAAAAATHRLMYRQTFDRSFAAEATRSYRRHSRPTELLYATAYYEQLGLTSCRRLIPQFKATLWAQLWLIKAPNAGLYATMLSICSFVCLFACLSPEMRIRRSFLKN